MKKRSALGNGVESLFSTSFENNVPEKEEVKVSPSSAFITPIEKIKPNQAQPRKIFDNDDLLDLANSIRQIGIIQPIVVKKVVDDDFYIIVAGERRWRAAQLAGLHEVPIVIKDCNEKEMLEMSIVENIQREDLNIVEEAEAYQALQSKYSLSHEEISKRVGKDRSTVTNTLRILKLPAEIQKDLIDNKLAMGHARALLSLDNKKDQLNVRNTVISKGLNVRQTEQLIRKIKNPAPVKNQEENPNLCYLTDNLQKHFGTKVAISAKKDNKGKIEIAFASFEDLERILELMNASF